MRYEQRGVLTIITGPQGVGKDSIINELGVRKVVSHATRRPRPNEVDGVDYHFVTPDEFLDMQHDGKFVEHIGYPSPNGNGIEYKGTAQTEFNRVLQGETLAWRVEPSAAANAAAIIRGNFPTETAEQILASTLVFYIGTPTLWELSKRLRNRSQEISSSEILRMIKSSWQDWKRFQGQFGNVIINEPGKVTKAASSIAEKIELARKNNIH